MISVIIFGLSVGALIAVALTLIIGAGKDLDRNDWEDRP